MFTSQQSAIALISCLATESLDTPLAQWVRHVCQLKNLDDDTKIDFINSWVLNPCDYESPSVFSSDYQLHSLLRKASFAQSVRDIERDKAYQKFQSAEALCAQVNARFRPGFKCNRWFSTILSRARSTIAYVLGDTDACISAMELNADYTSTIGVYPQVDVFSSAHGKTCVYVNPKGRFGPGVSVAPGLRGQPYRFYTGWERALNPSTTADHVFRSAYESRGFSAQTIVRGDVLTFVKKNRDEARCICPTPSLNMMSQLMIGGYIKSRLKSVLRVDLWDQSRNQSLARLGSLTGSYATIDLSSASDSIASYLVFELVPIRWFHLLDSCRSKFYFDPILEIWTPYEKFSPMGNGFTFELETLIFYAIAEAAAYLARNGNPLSKEEISVYGDDIIVPTDTALDTMSALMLCGFTINSKKSFTHGPFRESCGGDFFKGHLVTPFKIKEFQDGSTAQAWVQCYNELYHRSESCPILRAPLPRLCRTLRFIKSRVRDHLPGISVFQEEWDRFGLPSPTNRWLVGGYSDFENVYFDKHFQTCLPRRVAIESVEVVSVYDLHPDLCGLAWATSCRLPEPTLTKSTYGLKRYRPSQLTHKVRLNACSPIKDRIWVDKMVSSSFNSGLPGSHPASRTLCS